MIHSRKGRTWFAAGVCALVLVAACGGNTEDSSSSAQAPMVVKPVCFANVDGICTLVASCDANDPLCSCAGLVCRSLTPPPTKLARGVPSQIVCDCPVPGV